MKNTFKKITASIVAVASLVVSMTSFSASAVEPRVGGSKTFSVSTNGTATATIDRTTTFGYASTKCSYSNAKYVCAMVTARSSVDGALTDVKTINGPGTAAAQKNVTNCYSASSYHSVTHTSGSVYSTEMSA